MVKETLPQLSEALIRRMASESSFERGKSYYRSGAILAYIHETQAFRVIPPLEALLAPRSQQELIALIGEVNRAALYQLQGE